MQSKAVPQSLDSWSQALGIEVVRSTGSLVAIDRSVSVKEFMAKNRHGIHGFLRRNARYISQSMSIRHTKVAPAMSSPIAGIGDEKLETFASLAIAHDRLVLNQI
ncbi:hypothetical protein Syun_031135 [Stephania yunnanensis]|uniref:Uncharacterized protein n=1 Tax=Stephania yunnanensis TaxID=152371 RepID=A0AAP0DUJ0_9MAGN